LINLRNTQTIHGGPGRLLEITYLLIPRAIEARFEVRLKLKELGHRSHRVVYGKIKASVANYGNKSVNEGGAGPFPLAPRRSFRWARLWLPYHIVGTWNSTWRWTLH
jgi:hypothetical protein